MPSFDFVVSDFSAKTELDIRGANLLQAILRLLHAVPGGDLHKELDTIMFLLKGEVSDAAGEQIFRVILHYIFNAVEGVGIDEVIQVAGRQLSAEKEREAMTIAEQLINEGKKQGMQQGMQQGVKQGMQQEAQKTLSRILSKRFGDVPSMIEKQVNAASVEQVEDWIDRALDANAITDVFPNV